MNSNLANNILAIKNLKKSLDTIALSSSRPAKPHYNEFWDRAHDVPFSVVCYYSDWVTRIVEVNSELCFIGLDLAKCIDVQVFWSEKRSLLSRTAELDERAQNLCVKIKEDMNLTLGNNKIAFSSWGMPIDNLKYLPLVVYNFKEQQAMLLANYYYTNVPIEKVLSGKTLPKNTTSDILKFYTSGNGGGRSNYTTILLVQYGSRGFNVY